jgi:hypothetical protein
MNAKTPSLFLVISILQAGHSPPKRKVLNRHEFPSNYLDKTFGPPITYARAQEKASIMDL